jgi:hypothetical protein
LKKITKDGVARKAGAGSYINWDVVMRVIGSKAGMGGWQCYMSQQGQTSSTCSCLSLIYLTTNTCPIVYFTISNSFQKVKLSPQMYHHQTMEYKSFDQHIDLGANAANSC